MTRILAFGDSFVAGDQDDFITRDRANASKFSAAHGMDDETRLEFLKNNINFAALIAKHFGTEFVNHADSGSSNYRQLDRLMQVLHQGELRSTDVIMFGITTTTRDRLSLTHAWKPGLHHNLMHNWKSGLHNMVDVCIQGHNNWDLLELHDTFFILAILDSVSKQYNVPIIKFNLFDNLFNTGVTTKISYPQTDFMGWGFKNNTLFDILDDTWCLDVIKPRILHIDSEPEEQYKKFYTWNKHPSILGHEKIKDWFLKNVDWQRYIK